MIDEIQFNQPYPLKTSVLFLVFNRIDTTKRVFEAIREAKPPRLYIASDGFRENKEGEKEKVQAVRDFVLNSIDWDCEVKTLLRDNNFGCKNAVSGAISWFFETEEQGIILEDDCLPSQSFFWYCEDLLEKYKDDSSIYLISGDGRASEFIEMREDFGFCKYPIIWGWASWSRIWKNYDPDIQDWPIQRKNLPALVSKYKPTIRFWYTTFERMYNREIDTWDYQFSYLLLKNKGKCIVPKLNLITNIGFGLDATHTLSAESEAANRNRYEINFPLTYEPNPDSEIKLNNFYDRNEFFLNSFFVRFINKISSLIIDKTILK